VALDQYTFDRGMDRLQANWPEKKITPEQMALYAEMLGPLDPAVFADAINAAIHTCEWFPKISKLVKLAGGVERHGGREWAHVACGNAPSDSGRVNRLGAMMASPLPEHADYARLLVDHMSASDHDQAMKTFHSSLDAARQAAPREAEDAVEDIMDAFEAGL